MSSPKAPAPPQFEKAVFTPLDAKSIQYLDPADANQLATEGDRSFYDRSDADYQARNPALAEANRVNNERVLRDIKGDLDPALQSEFVRAGLINSLSAFGGGTAPGTAGGNQVARQLGISLLDYQDRNRKNLADAITLNPQRTFGLDGTSLAGIKQGNIAQANDVTTYNAEGANRVAIANATGQNNMNQATYAGQTNSANAASAGRNSMIAGGVGAAASIGAAALIVF